MGRVGNLYVGIGLDSKNFKKDLDNLYGKLKLSKQQFKTTTAQMSSFGIVSGKLKIKAKALSNQIESQKAIVNTLKIKIKTVNSKEGDHHGKLLFYNWKRRA